MLRHQLADDQWECIDDLFPPAAKTGRPRRDPRQVMNAILWVLRTGAPWRDLPSEYGPWQSIWHLFNQWNANGLLDRILQRLRAAHVDVGAIDEELWCVDGTVVRAHRCAAGGGKKKTRTSRKTTPWAARGAVFPPKSTCSATATATRSTSSSRRAKRTSRKP
jgi:transposase